MLLKIDDLSRPDHCFLDANDCCFYLREYTSREGPYKSSDNQLVYNLKCPIDHQNKGRIFYKNQAIATAAKELSEALDGFQAADVVFIPIPPSKNPKSPQYDPRVRDILRVSEQRIGIRVVEALETRFDRNAVHDETSRPSVDELAGNLVVRSNEWIGSKIVALFDDVLVTGAQFKAAVQVLTQQDPAAKFVGVFWVRRVFPS